MGICSVGAARRPRISAGKRDSGRKSLCTPRSGSAPDPPMAAIMALGVEWTYASAVTGRRAPLQSPDHSQSRDIPTIEHDHTKRGPSPSRWKCEAPTCSRCAHDPATYRGSAIGRSPSLPGLGALPPAEPLRAGPLHGATLTGEAGDARSPSGSACGSTRPAGYARRAGARWRIPPSAVFRRGGLHAPRVGCRSLAPGWRDVAARRARPAGHGDRADLVAAPFTRRSPARRLVLAW